MVDESPFPASRSPGSGLQSEVATCRYAPSSALRSTRIEPTRPDMNTTNALRIPCVLLATTCLVSCSSGGGGDPSLVWGQGNWGEKNWTASPVAARFAPDAPAAAEPNPESTIVNPIRNSEEIRR